MYQIIYLSEVALPVPEHRLERLIERSRAANLAKGITSLLLRDGAAMLQVIEGPREAVVELMDRIGADRRHSEIRLLSAATVMGREFDMTPLAYVDAAAHRALPEDYQDLRPKIRQRTVTKAEAYRALEMFSGGLRALDHLAAIVIDNPRHAGQPAA